MKKAAKENSLAAFFVALGGGVLPGGKRSGNSDPRSCLATASFCQFAHRAPMKTGDST